MSEKEKKAIERPKEPRKKQQKESVVEPSLKKNKIQNKRYSIINIVIIMTLFVGLLFLGSEVFQQQKQMKEYLTTQQLKETQQLEQINNLQKKALLQQNQQQQLSGLKKELLTLEGQASLMQSQLNLTQQKLSEEKGGVELELLLSEADFLIRTAAIRLVLTDNAKSSINLLEAADKRLMRMNDVGVISVREALTEDLYKLKASEQVDLTGAYLRLEVLGNEIDHLKINFILPESQKQEEVQKQNLNWKEHITNSSEKVINKWFQVINYSEKIKPLKSPSQIVTLKQRLLLTIKQAQWVLIQKQMELYQLILKGLLKEVRVYFNETESALIREEIKKLISESLVAPLPKKLTVETSIKKYIKNQKNSGKN